jgi:hypothetical protein
LLFSGGFGSELASQWVEALFFLHFCLVLINLLGLLWRVEDILGKLWLQRLLLSLADPALISQLDFFKVLLR